ncbi:DNA-binding response OmpR family regulator [Chryseobacterium ginsenosidimutans]|uniref:response regulator n=1 Tax=Chryseobacterium ginsenosidimutans TaxID=687846 RepID=UPI00216A103E|nr:response regulator [Chryseobacterium ginsenosidimutans]MCS3868396.1 DNA-binding response OmpR family regulator [Chryseobacterium ginsenosidimutans]
MNKEYVNVILADSDEGSHVLFKNIFQDLKMGIKVRTFFSGEDLMNYLNSEEAMIPEILFMNYDIPSKSSLECLVEIKSDFKFDHMVTAIYSDRLSVEEEEEVFVKEANIFMKQPDNYKDLKKVLTEIMTINWQYHTSGLNKNNFIMKV